MPHGYKKNHLTWLCALTVCIWPPLCNHTIKLFSFFLSFSLSPIEINGVLESRFSCLLRLHQRATSLHMMPRAINKFNYKLHSSFSWFLPIRFYSIGSIAFSAPKETPSFGIREPPNFLTHPYTHPSVTSRTGILFCTAAQLLSHFFFCLFFYGNASLVHFSSLLSINKKKKKMMRHSSSCWEYTGTKTYFLTEFYAHPFSISISYCRSYGGLVQLHVKNKITSKDWIKFQSVHRHFFFSSHFFLWKTSCLQSHLKPPCHVLTSEMKTDAESRIKHIN